HARRSTWMEGKHYRHVAPDMAPKQNSPIMYNRDEINHWIEHQSPAKRRRISA
ncbi:excisionase family protein, partial [Enterobacter hormaechei]|nr:excisionase family protein [Enterobacter hormaechei]